MGWGSAGFFVFLVLWAFSFCLIFVFGLLGLWICLVMRVLLYACNLYGSLWISFVLGCFGSFDFAFVLWVVDFRSVSLVLCVAGLRGC